jgi:hypothetical protein
VQGHLNVDVDVVVLVSGSRIVEIGAILRISECILSAEH